MLFLAKIPSPETSEIIRLQQLQVFKLQASSLKADTITGDGVTVYVLHLFPADFTHISQYQQPYCICLFRNLTAYQLFGHHSLRLTSTSVEVCLGETSLMS
jgi:hypothetical protein